MDMENRLKIALEFLKDGQSFAVGGLRLSVDSNSCLVVRGWSPCSSLTNLSKENSIRDLNDIKSLFGELHHSCEELEKFIEKRSVEYVLSFDDSGKTSIDICSERNGVLKWFIDLKQ